jgi:Tol biopolymer transport system component
VRIKFSILLVCVLFLTCKKDPPLPNAINEECVDLTDIPPFNDTIYNTPRFNPNNSNEIIYVQGIQSIDKINLVKLNLITGQKTYIITGVWRRPDWSIKDWIVFNHADNQVWKIKSNGDSLTLITPDMQGGHNAIWSPDGNKIAYIQEVGSTSYNLICDENGNHLDTIPYFAFYLNKWSYDNLNICAPAFNGVNVGYENIYTHQISQPTTNTIDAHSTNLIYIDAVDWMPDSKSIVWTNPYGIYKTNIATKQTTIIKTICGKSGPYVNLSVSPDGSKIIAQREDVFSGLCLMDIDGKNEVIIK